jgi:hypothetical protein
MAESNLQDDVKLKKQFNAELEIRVHERTHVLDETNQELERINKQLTEQFLATNQTNSLLDLDNWKLKNRVKEVLHEMLLDQPITHEVFKTIYPDSLACHRFLENLKWGKDFICLKCRNGKYCSGSKRFSRRCTRCGYTESITANTIFHGLKFPIEQAFYIVYLTVTGKQTETLASMASRLDLTLNTVCSYRSKIKIAISEFNTRSQKKTASKWESIIMNKFIESTRP